MKLSKGEVTCADGASTDAPSVSRSSPKGICRNRTSKDVTRHHRSYKTVLSYWLKLMSKIPEQKLVPNDATRSPMYENSRSEFKIYDQSMAVKKSDDDPFVGQIIGEHYVILSLIGTGALGAVYKANHKLLKKFVAIKFLRQGRQLEPNALIRFQREAQAAIGLTHQNIAGVQEFGIHDNMPYLVMELVEGDSLRKIISSEGALDQIRALKILKQLLQALSHAHNQGVIHRDVKPENIIVSRKTSGIEEVKLIDFGIAKVLEDPESIDITKSGEVFGTPYYMSPEQCRGMSVNNRTDIYSAGCVAYEMLSGSPPFVGDAAINVILQHVNNAPKLLPVSGQTTGLERVIDRALAKDANNRYGSANEMLSELELIEAGKAPRKTFHLSKKQIRRSISYSILLTLIFLSCSGLLVLIEGKEKTIQSLSKDIREHPDAIENYIDRAHLYAEKQHNYSAAIDDLEVAERINPSLPIVPELKSWFELESGLYSQAKIDADTAIDLSPKNHFAYIHRARANLQLKNYQNAVDDVNKAIELDPRNQSNWFTSCFLTRGYAHLKLNKLQNALQDADKAILYNIKPTTTAAANAGTDQLSLDAYNLRAKVNLRLKKYEDALADVQNALKIDPKADSSLCLKADALKDLGRYDEALDMLDQAIKLSPNTNYLTKHRAAIAKYKSKISAHSEESNTR